MIELQALGNVDGHEGNIISSIDIVLGGEQRDISKVIFKRRFWVSLDVVVDISEEGVDVSNTVLVRLFVFFEIGKIIEFCHEFLQNCAINFKVFSELVFGLFHDVDHRVESKDDLPWD